MATRREKSLQKAEKLVQRGRLEAAIDELRKVLDESPDDTRTLNRVGDLYARLNRVDEAVELFSQTAERFTKEGFFVKAIAIYKKILRLDPTRMPIYDSLAELYRHQGLTNEARVQYQVVADYYEKAEDNVAVVAVYEKLVELDVDDPEMRIRLGDLLLAADRADEALGQYRQAALALLGAGESDSALYVLQRAMEPDPANLEFVMETVLELQSAKQPEFLERFVEAAIELNPQAVQARELLASVGQVEEEEEEEEQEAAAAAAVPEEPEETPEEEPEPTPVVAEEAPEVAEEEPEEFEIELGAFEEAIAAESDDLAPEPVVEEPVEQPVVEQPAIEVPVEAEPVEPAPVEAAPVPDLDEMLTEADALASYGLAEKAMRRLESVLEQAPGHLGAYRRLIAIHADARRDTEVVRIAAQAATAALEAGNAGAWREVVSDLTQHGYKIEGSKIIPPPAPAIEVPAELFVDAPEAAEPEEVVEVEAEAEVAVESQPETAVETVDRAESAEEEELLEALTEEEPAEPEEVVEVPVPVGVESPGEADFFDLGAELADELEAMEEKMPESAEIEGQSVEEIVEGFKRGMAEVLSPEAYDTHYSLGVAYREMGLVDEAIGEFQLAAKDPRYLVESCSLLGQCFQEKDFADLAIKWYRKGLESKFISEEETLGLLYELGNLHLASGDRAAAKQAFTEIYGSNSNFRDVLAKLEELRDD